MCVYNTTPNCSYLYICVYIYMLFTDVRRKVHSLAQSFCKCRFPAYTYCSTTEYFRVCYMKMSLKHSWLSIVWLWIYKLSINKGSAIVKITASYYRSLRHCSVNQKFIFAAERWFRITPEHTLVKLKESYKFLNYKIQ